MTAGFAFSSDKRRLYIGNWVAEIEWKTSEKFHQFIIFHYSFLVTINFEKSLNVVDTFLSKTLSAGRKTGIYEYNVIGVRSLKEICTIFVKVVFWKFLK